MDEGFRVFGLGNPDFGTVRGLTFIFFFVSSSGGSMRQRACRQRAGTHYRQIASVLEYLLHFNINYTFQSRFPSIPPGIYLTISIGLVGGFIWPPEFIQDLCGFQSLFDLYKCQAACSQQKRSGVYIGVSWNVHKFPTVYMLLSVCTRYYMQRAVLCRFQYPKPYHVVK